MAKTEPCLLQCRIYATTDWETTEKRTAMSDVKHLMLYASQHEMQETT